jgi:hypothetical protein
MNILNNFDTDVNFWEMNPQFKLYDTFKDYYKNDKSRSKNDSSQVMWAIALLLDKSKHNQFRNIPIDEKKEQLAKHFIKDNKFDWDNPKIYTLMEAYKKFALSQAMRSMANWELKMKERDEFIANTPFSIDTAKELDTMLANYPKLFQTYKIIAESLELENDDDDKSNRKFVTDI